MRAMRRRVSGKGESDKLFDICMRRISNES
jgi:hypothetical protein